jgi:hypothetical protein
MSSSQYILMANIITPLRGLFSGRFCESSDLTLATLNSRSA